MPFCGNAQFETIAYTSYMFHCTRSWSWSTANKWSLVENSKPQIRFRGCFKGQNWQIPCVHPDVFRSWNLSWWPLRDELNMKIEKQIHDAPSKTLGSANGKIGSQKEIQVEDFRDMQCNPFLNPYNHLKERTEVMCSSAWSICGSCHAWVLSYHFPTF